jgi:hypothetical protein
MPSEVVRFACGDGRRFMVLCKYGTKGRTGCAEPGSVAYEAEVYSQVLRPFGVPVAECHGLAADGKSPLRWLVVEYLSEWARADAPSVQEAALPAAAGWLGAFQAAQDRLLAGAHVEVPLCRFDTSTYSDWVDRAIAVADSMPEHRRWLLAARPGYLEMLDLLNSRSGIVIHGDFYADNVLFRDGVICPIDWAWAVLAVGEIDLVTLVERWPPDMVRRCEHAYCQACWPTGAPADFEPVRDVARLLVLLRWMGHERTWSLDAKRRWRFDAARALSHQLGII